MRSRADINQRIWDGKYWGKDGAMPAARRYYYALPIDSGARIAWMSDLYSALGHEQASATQGHMRAILRVFWCLWHLYPQVKYFVTFPRQRRDELTANQCDVISTVLLQWARTLRNGPALAAARDYAERGMRIPMPAGGHTRALLLVTLAKVMIAHGDIPSVRACVEDALTLVADIDDVNQKARVLRSCAELVYTLKEERWHVTPRALLDEADRLPGLGEDVRFKNMHTRLSLGL